MRRLCIIVPVLSLLTLCQFLLPSASPRETRFFGYFSLRSGFAFDPDGRSGGNVRPEGATIIKQIPNSRWVIYDRGDKTDWLKVSPSNVDNTQLIIRFTFLKVKGTAMIEVYEEDPYGNFLEKREIDQTGNYEYVTQKIREYYVKVYAAEQGNWARYEFSYTLIPLLNSSSELTPMNTPIPFQTATLALSASDFKKIGKKYGVPFHLLQALSIVNTHDGNVPGTYEVKNVVDSSQLKFLEKIARQTDRPLSEFTGSSSGAMGYMQFMPDTFYFYAQDGDDDGIKDPLNPYDSVATGAYFFAQELAKQENIETALNSYTNDSTLYKKILQLYRELKTKR